ncbi:MAG: SfiI family type II restriction endonuclease [Gammaproteobacteria bacterium]|nr:SfiI family type II restriction endonuclease [Gammaproteobacteria bacterium]
MSLQIEEVERSCLRLVVRAIRDYHKEAVKIFREETDLPADVAEDITREALDFLGLSRVHIRLYGKIDYKRAALVFLPDRETEVALMIDSKAEKDGNTATIQMSQTSMEVRQLRAGRVVTVKGGLPTFIERSGVKMQTVTIIVKYVYKDEPKGSLLKQVKIACIPSGVFQDQYNPDAKDTIWRVGRNAPTLDEDFRVRLSFADLALKAPWRVVAF